MLTTLEDWRLNAVRVPRDFGSAQIEALMAELARRPHAAGFDLLLDYTGVRRFELSADDLVRLAMKRRAAFPDSPETPLKSAAIGASAEVREMVETWDSFFEERTRAIDTGVFDTLESALDWIGKPEAVDAARAALQR